MSIKPLWIILTQDFFIVEDILSMLRSSNNVVPSELRCALSKKDPLYEDPVTDAALEGTHFPVAMSRTLSSIMTHFLGLWI